MGEIEKLLDAELRKLMKMVVGAQRAGRLISAINGDRIADMSLCLYENNLSPTSAKTMKKSFHSSTERENELKIYLVKRFATQYRVLRFYFALDFQAHNSLEPSCTVKKILLKQNKHFVTLRVSRIA